MPVRPSQRPFRALRPQAGPVQEQVPEQAARPRPDHSSSPRPRRAALHQQQPAQTWQSLVVCPAVLLEPQAVQVQESEQEPGLEEGERQVSQAYLPPYAPGGGLSILCRYTTLQRTP